MFASPFSSYCDIEKPNQHARNVAREKLRQQLSEQCAVIFSKVETDAHGDASREDLIKLLPKIEKVFQAHDIGFAPSDFELMIDIMDQDNSGGVDEKEFSRGIVLMAEGVQPISFVEIHCDLHFVKSQVISAVHKLDESSRDLNEVNKLLSDFSQTTDVLLRHNEEGASNERQDLMGICKELLVSLQQKRQEDSYAGTAMQRDLSQLKDSVDMLHQSLPEIVKAGMAESRNDIRSLGSKLAQSLTMRSASENAAVSAGPINQTASTSGASFDVPKECDDGRWLVELENVCDLAQFALDRLMNQLPILRPRDVACEAALPANVTQLHDNLRKAMDALEKLEYEVRAIETRKQGFAPESCEDKLAVAGSDDSTSFLKRPFGTGSLGKDQSDSWTASKETVVYAPVPLEGAALLAGFLNSPACCRPVTAACNLAEITK